MVYKICHRRVYHTKLMTSTQHHYPLKLDSEQDWDNLFYIAADTRLRIPRKRTIISRNRDTHILAVNLTPRDIRELAKVPFAICTKLLAFKNLEKKEVFIRNKDIFLNRLTWKSDMDQERNTVPVALHE